MVSLPSAVVADLLTIRLSDTPLSDVLARLSQAAKDGLPAADEVSITLVRGDRPWTAAYTGQLALDADELQYERGYGPCVDAGVSNTLLRVSDMREETRWPDYAAAVVPRGVLSSLSVPLPIQTEVVGALNCYSRKPGSFDDDTNVALGVELAGYVAVAVGNAVAYTDAAELAEQMRQAMVSRSVIDQAKGVIMAQNRCTPEEAFGILRRASQGRNVKLRDIAHQLVAGVAPQEPGDPASGVV